MKDRTSHPTGFELTSWNALLCKNQGHVNFMGISERAEFLAFGKLIINKTLALGSRYFAAIENCACMF